MTVLVTGGAGYIGSHAVVEPLEYYLNNTVKSRALIETAVERGIKHFIFSSTAATYGETDVPAVTEETRTEPVSPYGRSKLMTEWMLQDTARVTPLKFAA